MPSPTVVTPDNFVRAETDRYSARFAQGGVGVLVSQREPANAENQKVVRDNPNVLGVLGIVDLDAGPATITMPDPGDRFVSLMVTSEDHYTTTHYEPGPHALTREEIA